MKYTRKGMLKNVQDGTSRCFGGQETNKTKVLTILWDTLYQIRLWMQKISGKTNDGSKQIVVKHLFGPKKVGSEPVKR